MDIDKKLSEGLVSEEVFRQLLDAEIYGTATPMQWLEKRLNKLTNVLKQGRIITIETESQKLTIHSRSEFKKWCKSNFPDAYACFYKHKK